MSPVHVSHPVEILHGNGAALACGPDGQIQADALHGLFVSDTRVLSTYRLTIGGQPWVLLSRSRSGYGSARWSFQNPRLRDPSGELDAGTLFLDLRRRVAGALHDDLTVRCYAPRRFRSRFVFQLDADFADLFQVKDQLLPPRLNIARVPNARGMSLTYQRGSFSRRLRVRLDTPERPTVAGALMILDLDLGPGDEWTCCLEAEAEVDGRIQSFHGDPHDEEPAPVGEGREVALESDDLLTRAFDRGRADLRSLAIAQDGEPPYVAAGAPWFMTLFGRDSLVTALMSGLAGTWPAHGALAALGRLQSTERDDWRDAEPGKIPHEVRRGELAHFGVIPHTPYYGSHDAPALFCLTLWQAWRWSGDQSLVDAHFEAARAALRWCDELGDRDGDGLQEYGTRSSRGLYNQGWKDSGDAIVDERGGLAKPPVATLELQGYLYAARLAMAELTEEAGDRAEAQRLRSAAEQLRGLVEDRFWMPEHGFYAMALDGRKRPMISISSNPGQLLWSGVPNRLRADLVANRLLSPELFSGWGIRTLSSSHPVYNPLSYQRGSVWPHDTLLAAAGLWRYGLREAASTLIRGMLDAASAFEDHRLPELFCGFERSLGPPVPYVEANVPQAWSAAALVLVPQLFLGLLPDAPRQRCYLAPWLPDWLTRVEARGITVGEGNVDVAVVRRDEATAIDHLEATGVVVHEGSPEAPLWGTPFGEA